MSNEQLQILALIMANNAYILGMQADNARSAACGDHPKWDYSDFARQASDLEELASKAINS